MVIRNGVDENAVIALWRELVAAGYGFTTENRQSVNVRYTGRISETSGADLRDVALELDGHPMTGNIEFHVAAGDWCRHGHQKDPAYNSVVLHVVMWRQSGEITYLENGRAVPTVAIGKYYDGIKQSGLETASARTLFCQQVAGKFPDETAAILREAGWTRFRAKAKLIESEFSQKPAEEILYIGIMEALGYSANKIPFKKLAGAVPYSTIKNYARDQNSNKIEAILYGTAGLLPSQRTHVEPSIKSAAYLEVLENEWQNSGTNRVLGCSEWSFFRLRPGNHPSRRLSGMIGLLRNFHTQGLLPGLARLVSSSALEENGKSLVQNLVMPAGGYWLHHFDFGKECPGLNPWSIGEGRAEEIIVNVVLPFYYFWGKRHGDSKIMEKSLRLYSVLPALEENTVEKHMRAQLGLKRNLGSGVILQQGLLHLYKQYCVQGRCSQCPVGKL